MNPAALGLIFTLLFVFLEAVQFVYFGNIFQKVDSFLIGFFVFGLTVTFSIAWTAVYRPKQLKTALALPKQLFLINLGAVVTFTAYLLSVQLIEPAIVYTISAGTMPITALILSKLGVREGGGMRNIAESSGSILIFFSIVFLAAITLFGYSGFVRGDTVTAWIGIFLAIVDGVFFTLILVYSQRLNQAGVGPEAVLGLRLPLYLLVTGLVVFTRTETNETISAMEISIYVTIGFLLTIPPLYLLQKAVPLLPTLTISALTALGPMAIFALQNIEGRVAYSAMTITGLTIYVAGAMLLAVGAVTATNIRE